MTFAVVVAIPVNVVDAVTSLLSMTNETSAFELSIHPKFISLEDVAVAFKDEGAVSPVGVVVADDSTE